MSNQFPSDLKYTKDHEWAKVEGDVVTIGITDHAQNALGEVVFVEVPAVGKQLNKGDTFGVVESIKAVSDVYAPVTGKVVETHGDLSQDPGTLNKDPYKQGWLIKIQVTDQNSLQGLMSAAEYASYVENLK